MEPQLKVEKFVVFTNVSLCFGNFTTDSIVNYRTLIGSLGTSNSDIISDFE